MVVIRLSRSGAKKRPFYQVVVTDSRKRRDGGSIESVGYYNPVARGQEIPVSLNIEKIQYWLSVGAQLSDRVASLVKHYNKKTAA